MNRPLLAESAIHPAIRQRIAEHHLSVIQQVQNAIAQHAVVVVGLSGNPFVGKARKALAAAGRGARVHRVRQLFLAMAFAQCAENVDRLAHVPDGLCARHLGRWGR
jgi:hypothetical protein